MSGGLAPSKSTVYVSNLPFSLTNSDLHKILEKYGKVVKVTIVKDKATRRSKGVAFVLFLEREFAHQCCRALNNTKMFGRTITCSIAKDNGRAAEFIRRKEYTDKTKCYECGDEGHLSYNCPKNLLGEREPPKKKERKRKKGADGEDIVESGEESDSSNQPEDPGGESLASAIQQQQNAAVGEKSLLPTDIVFGPSTSSWDEEPKKKKYKKDAYFSDEEELDGD